MIGDTRFHGGGSPETLMNTTKIVPNQAANVIVCLAGGAPWAFFESARLLHTTRCSERLMAMLKFLGDETGTDKLPRTRISAVAGLVGTEKSWKRFDSDWLGVLKHEGIPCFHAVECENGRADFHGMDVVRRGKIVEQLARVILDSSLRPHSYGVVIPHFKEMSFEFRNHFTNKHPEVPYWLCLYATFTEVSHAADDLPAEEQVYFLFEEQNEFEKDARESFDAFKANKYWPNSKRLGKCCFVKKEEAHEYPGLQAADLLAYESYRHLDNRHFWPDLKLELKMRTVHKLLKPKLKQRGKYFDRDTLVLLDGERTSGKYDIECL
jgi:hypothetical protein